MSVSPKLSVTVRMNVRMSPNESTSGAVNVGLTSDMDDRVTFAPEN